MQTNANLCFDLKGRRLKNSEKRRDITLVSHREWYLQL